MSISPLARVYPGVVLGADVVIGDFAIVGQPAAGQSEGAVPTIIGDGAVIRSHTVIYAGNRIGKKFQTGHGAMIREDNVIGDNVSVGSQSVVEHHVTLADGVRIHSQAFVPEYSVVETGAWIGPRVCVTNARWPASRKAKDYLHGVTICTKARIGANSTLLPGVRIGAEALVGAGSVVTVDVPPRAVVVGNPAKVIKDVGDLRYPDDPDTPVYA